MDIRHYAAGEYSGYDLIKEIKEKNPNAAVILRAQEITNLIRFKG